MTLATYPTPTRGGGYSIAPDGTKRDSWSTRCSDCGHGFTTSSPKEAQRMWWEHVRDEHPNAWAVLRDDAPDDLPIAADYWYPRYPQEF